VFKVYKIGIGINYTNQLQQTSPFINCVISGVVLAKALEIASVTATVFKLTKKSSALNVARDTYLGCNGTSSLALVNRLPF